MTTLVLIRHCPTSWNETGRLQGRTDVPLSPAGRALAAESLPNLDLPGVHWHSSPLARAMETARIWGAKPGIDTRLVETDWGKWEGMDLPAIRRELKGYIPGIDYPDIDFQPPGGESGRMVQERIKPWLAEMSAAGSPAAAVTHKGVILAAMAMANRIGALSQLPKIKPGIPYKFIVTAEGSLSLLNKRARVEHTKSVPSIS